MYFMSETRQQTKLSLFKWRVTVSGELMFLKSNGNCDVTITVSPLLWPHKIISYYNFW